MPLLESPSDGRRDVTYGGTTGPDPLKHQDESACKAHVELKTYIRFSVAMPRFYDEFT